jgi:hypothetical protein
VIRIPAKITASSPMFHSGSPSLSQAEPTRAFNAHRSDGVGSARSYLLTAAILAAILCAAPLRELQHAAAAFARSRASLMDFSRAGSQNGLRNMTKRDSAACTMSLHALLRRTGLCG